MDGNDFVAIFQILLQDMEDDMFSASERVVERIDLPDGRRAEVTMRIDTDENDWMLGD